MSALLLVKERPEQEKECEKLDKMMSCGDLTSYLS